MPLCKRSDGDPSLIPVLYLSVGCGAVLTFLVNVVYAFKWHWSLEREFRRKRIPMQCTVLITLMTIERVTRFFEVLSWYQRSIVWMVLYHSNNLVIVSGIFYTLLSILSERYIRSFEGSVFEITEQESKTLSRLKWTLMIFLNLFFLLNGIHAVSYTLIGQIILMGLAVLVLILGLTFVIRVDHGYIYRLRLLVAKHSACSHSAMAKTPTLQGPCDVNDNVGNHLRTGNTLTLPSNGRSNTPDSRQSMTQEHSHQVSEMDLSEIEKRSTLSGLRTASILQFPESDHFLLEAAAKDGVIATVITVSVIGIFVSGLCFGMSECHHWATVLGHWMLVVCFPLIAVCVTLSLPKSEHVYHHCFGCCHSCLLRLVSWQTTRMLFFELTRPETKDGKPISTMASIDSSQSPN